MSSVGEDMSKLNLTDEAAPAAVNKQQNARDEQREQIAGQLEESGWKSRSNRRLDPREWGATAQRYEWNDEYGDVAPAIPELERQLFQNDTITRAGANFDGLDIAVVVESEEKVAPVTSFDDAGLHPVVRHNVELCLYQRPTPIQSYCLPAILTGHDIIAVAQTGSGKTAAFLIPILSKLMGKAMKLRAPRPPPMADISTLMGRNAEPLVLIIVPTRELSLQIFDEARRLCYRSMLRPCIAYGGAPSRDQADELRRGCDILIGTPGRLMDFIGRGNLIKLGRVKYTVIDEADELVSPDWVEDMCAILDSADNNVNADHRYMLFSATFPSEARRLAKQYLLNNHIRIRVGRMGSSHKNIKQVVIETSPWTKQEALKDLILSLPATRTLVFVNRKETADLVDDYLHHLGFPSTSIHSDRPQPDREEAIQAFKCGTTPILVATAVSARGLDITNIMHVINYDLPATRGGVPIAIAEYVHRIGRTARIGNEGFATSFFTDRDEDLGPMLVRTLKETNQEIPEFLAHFTPLDGEPLDFEDESEKEMESGNEAPAGEGGDAWGGGGNGDDNGNGNGSGNGDGNAGWGGNDDNNAGGNSGWGASRDADQKKEEVDAGW